MIDKDLTAAANGVLFGDEDKNSKEWNPGMDVGSRPEITDLINKSRFTPMLTNLIGEFDPPVDTHVGVLPISTEGERKHSILPFYNAFIHMDGLTTVRNRPPAHETPPGQLDLITGTVHRRFLRDCVWLQTMGQNGDPGVPFSSLFGNESEEDLELFQVRFSFFPGGFRHQPAFVLADTDSEHRSTT